MSALRLERRIVIISTAFALSLFGLAALAVNLYHVGLPTCLTDIRPFQRGELIMHSQTHFELHYVAKMWEFEPKEVTIPAGATVDVYVSTPDVTHGLILLGTNLNLMVVNYARIKIDQPGAYNVLCHEYCGTGHDRMAAVFNVVNPTQFEPENLGPKTASPETNPTYQLLETKECITCHSTDGSEGIGPTFKGMFGRATKLSDGSTITADDAYIRESIVNPSLKIVNQYDDLMPKPELTDKELDEIMEYLKTLK